MKFKPLIAALLMAASVGPVAALAAPPHHDRDRHDWRDNRHDRYGRHDNGNWRDGRRYDYNRPDPRFGRYDASHYYRDGRYYRERRLGAGDRIYRGGDGRYYCRRDDGTTGLLIGALGGGVLGNVLAPGDSSTLGTIIGGGLGAVLGRSIDRSDARCR